jgi:transposase-like protein
MASVLNEPYFHDEAAAFAALEAILWPEGPTCPHCGAVDRINRLAVQKTKPSKKHPKGKPVHGLWKCYHCRGQFTVRKNTVFEASKLELHQWFQATYLLCSSKKGCSSHQLARTLGVTVKTAWFASHRIREAMRDGSLGPMGGAGSVVEIDETVIGKIEGAPKQTYQGYGQQWRNTVLALVERGGNVRTFHVSGTTTGTLVPIIRANIQRETFVMTDEASWYRSLGATFDYHEAVNHTAKEYVRRDFSWHAGKLQTLKITTNTVEGYFSIFKRGMKGVYQHCKERHLHRYLAEFDFRYNARVALGVNDSTRTTKALRGIVGKRLMYRDSSRPSV